MKAGMIVRKEDHLSDACKNQENLYKYVTDKALQHRNFKHYVSDIKRINNILKEGALFLSDGTNWNDIDDRNAFCNTPSTNINEKNYRMYGLCLSFSSSENVAMWMLYGGMHKKGAMIDITPSSINQLINGQQIQIELGNFEGSKWVPEYDISSKKGVHIGLTDVLYYEPDNKEKIISYGNSYNIKRSMETTLCRAEILDSKELSSEMFFPLQKKKWAWSYENECRLIMSVDLKALPQGICSKAHYAKLYFPDKNKFVSGVKKRIFLAPNFQGDLSCFSEHNVEYKKSNLAIDWDLCRNCDNRKSESNVQSEIKFEELFSND